MLFILRIVTKIIHAEISKFLKPLYKCKHDIKEHTMILLFGNKAARNPSTGKNNGVKNNPVENSGILASNSLGRYNFLTVGQYDTYSFSTPTVVDYSQYAGEFYADDFGFMSDFSNALATIGEGGFSDCGFSDCGFSDSCSSFSSVG